MSLKTIVLLTTTLLAASVGDALAWGANGHRITGAIGERYLTADAQAAVRAILEPGETLAEAATWADFVRSDPAWKKADPWHYVTLLDGAAYAPDKAPADGDAMTALAHFQAVLRDKTASRADRQAALRFVVHLVGDLHQPLHVGCRADHGANDVKVEFFGAPTSLHAVWDSRLIAHEELSYSELANGLAAKITPEQAALWSTPDPLVWMAESSALCATLYPPTAKLSYEYEFAHQATVHQRLQQGGLRIAATLNGLFAAR
jgi:hypothetical protein